MPCDVTKESYFERMRIEEEHLWALTRYHNMVGMAIFLHQSGDKHRSQRALYKAERFRRDSFRSFSRSMKKLYPRAWPPPKKKLNKTSFKGKHRGDE